MTTLYRLFNADNTLLYVGIAENVALRLGQHRGSKPWWADVSAIRLEEFRDRMSAVAAEIQAIQSERPRHNIVHNGSAAIPSVGATTERLTLSIGWPVGIALREPVGDIRYWAGQIQAIDETGIRITPINWLVGTFDHYDTFIPWANIVGVSNICTEDHDTGGWMDSAGQAQSHHHGKVDGGV